MRSVVVSLLFLFFTSFSFAQMVVTGTVTNRKGEPIPGANVIIGGTYRGTVTDSTGSFTLRLNDSDTVLIASFIGYSRERIVLKQHKPSVTLRFVLKKLSQRIDEVVITAGTYETADRQRSVTLQPLDIVTIPSAAGDIYGALSALPGTAPIGDDGRLFVRGGDAYEAKTFIDGLLVKKPYTSSFPDFASRGRFSPFLFSGTTFCTGGYSAQYGQALSSALILTSNSFPQNTQTEISLLTVGTGINRTYSGKRVAFTLGAEYMNLQPYYSVVKNRFEMNPYPQTIGLTFSSHLRVSDSASVKLFSTYSQSKLGLLYPDFNSSDSKVDLLLNNSNSYSNATYTGKLSDGWLLKAGFAYSYDWNTYDFSYYDIDEHNTYFQLKATLKRKFNTGTALLLGMEEGWNRFDQRFFRSADSFRWNGDFDDYTTALYSEVEQKVFRGMAIRAGVRAEQSSLLNKWAVAPRFAAAVSLSASSQISLAYGRFYQTPEESLLRFTHRLNFESATHYIANFQWEKKGRILRLETYYKDYDNLVTYDELLYWNADSYSNSGSGYSRGIDLFYRDRSTFRFMEYWLSYSYVDSKRKYRAYPQKVRPTFAPEHTLSVVAKTWIPRITSQIGVSMTYSSGRPYNDPNKPGFMTERVPFYQDISVNCSHLRKIFGKSAIIYLSVSNILGRENIYGYRFYNQPDSDGKFRPYAIMNGTKRFYLAALFITL